MTAPASPGTLPDAPQRLSKVVAALVPCSRREAEQYIAEGWVRVDGQCVEEPQVRVTAAQRVEIDAKAVGNAVVGVVGFQVLEWLPGFLARRRLSRPVRR